MVMAALYIVRRPINVWRITASGKAEIIVTYGLPDGADGAGGGTGAGINLLWHQAGHYGETQRGEAGSVEEFKILIQTPRISHRTETFIAVFIFDRACGFQTLHLRLERFRSRISDLRVRQI